MAKLIPGIVAIMVVGAVVSAKADQSDVERVIGAKYPAYRTALLDYIKLVGMQPPIGEPAPRTRDEWEKRRGEIRSKILESLGLSPLPPRTALRPRIMGTLDRAEYRVEKVVFESRPRFHVTCSLYIPTGRKLPAPAILCPHGHSADGKAAYYQNLYISLAKKGYVVLAPDCRGYGETYDPRGAYQGESEYLAVTDSVLLGRHLFGMRLYDAIRSADYLRTRAEVDGLGQEFTAEQAKETFGEVLETCSSAGEFAGLVVIAADTPYSGKCAVDWLRERPGD